MPEDLGWVCYTADRHGRPASEGNEHLTAEQLTELSRLAEDRAASRGRRQAVVVVDVYESGEAVLQVQFPKDSTVDVTNNADVDAWMALAAEALGSWR